jgi:hypothetical protein
MIHIGTILGTERKTHAQLCEKNETQDKQRRKMHLKTVKLERGKTETLKHSKLKRSKTHLMLNLILHHEIGHEAADNTTKRPLFTTSFAEPRYSPQEGTSP